MIDKPVLVIKNLCVSFFTSRGELKVLDHINLSLFPGQITGIIGETGCGKTITAFSVTDILPPTAKITQGSIRFRGQELLLLREKEKEMIRGKQISTIFQDPSAALNPAFTIGHQLLETICYHNKTSRKAGYKIATDLLKMMGIADVDKLLAFFPHQLSGGLRQYAAITLALASFPQIIIADEPTSSLDVTLQDQLVRFFCQLRNQGQSILFISHDISLAQLLCDNIVVMYCGTIVEAGTVRQIIFNPQHPYTTALLQAIPIHQLMPGHNYPPISGQPPVIDQWFQGCSFYSRCSRAMAYCQSHKPPLVFIDERHKVACWHHITLGKKEIAE